MENVINRHRTVTILVMVLFAQVIGLAVQVRRPVEGEPVRLIRVWATTAISPIEKGVIGLGNSLHRVWSGYVDLRGARRENEGLRQQIEQLQLQQLRQREDAAQARRLQALLGFKEQFISQTLPAQVIGTSGSEQSRLVYLDRGASDGVKPDMPVVSPDGLVGKVARADRGNCTVLLINDQLSGVGAMMEKSRLQGIVSGAANGTLILQYIMSDEKVEPGDMVVASGGDRVFPKGMPIGRVKSVSRGASVFYSIELQPAAELSRLEEVLIITKLEQRAPEAITAGSARAADILANRLPTVPPPAPTDENGNPLPPSRSNPPIKPNASNGNKPPAAGGTTRPATSAGGNPATAGTATPTPKPKKSPAATAASGEQDLSGPTGAAEKPPETPLDPKDAKTKKDTSDKQEKKEVPPKPDGPQGAR